MSGIPKLTEPGMRQYELEQRLGSRSTTLRTAVRALLTAATLSVGLGISMQVTADDKVTPVISEQVKAEEAARASQKKIEQLDNETSRMLSDYRQMIAETQSLKSYNAELGTQVQSQQSQLQNMNKQIDEIATTSREVLPMMQKMLAALDQFVALDIPFLLEERSNRVATLKEMMGRADVSVSEKYRRIVEAYQIEMEYGRTIEAYQGQIGDRTVDFLRAGRVSLMYQTLDGKETGYWDADSKSWVVDPKYQDAMRAGLKVAKKQAAPDFVSVAIHAPKEIG